MTFPHKKLTHKRMKRVSPVLDPAKGARPNKVTSKPSPLGAMSPEVDLVVGSRRFTTTGRHSPYTSREIWMGFRARLARALSDSDIDGRSADESIQTAAARVYRRTALFSRLVGWVADDGLTYRREPWGRGRLIDWSADEAGRIYLEFEEIKTLIGWTDASGVLYDRFLLDYRTWLPQNQNRQYMPRELVYPNRPGLLGFVKSDGTVYRSRPLRSRRIGQVTGTSDIRLTGGLALVLLFD